MTVYMSGYHVALCNGTEIINVFYSELVEYDLYLDFVNHESLESKGYDIKHPKTGKVGCIVFTKEKLTEEEYSRIIKKEEIDRL